VIVDSGQTLAISASDIGDVNGLSVKIKHVRADEIGRGRTNKNIGRIGDVLKSVLPPSEYETDVRQLSLSWLFVGSDSETEVSTYTVNRQRSQAYTVDSVVKVVDPRVLSSLHPLKAP
jgi:hypothetical protein